MVHRSYNQRRETVRVPGDKNKRAKMIINTEQMTKESKSDIFELSKEE
jgi:hypothetical protein